MNGWTDMRPALFGRRKNASDADSIHNKLLLCSSL